MVFDSWMHIQLAASAPQVVICSWLGDIHSIQACFLGLIDVGDKVKTILSSNIQTTKM